MSSSNPGSPPESGGWVGGIGPEACAGRLARLPRVLAGRNWVLACGREPGEPILLSGCGVRGAAVTLGDAKTAGCSATIRTTGAVPVVTLECDPFGIHRIFRWQERETQWFASHPALLPLPARTIAPAALHGYLCFSHVPQPLTIWSDVTILPPAPLPEPRAGGDLRDLLRAAVETRLGTGRDIGVYLSGGLDSSLVAALLCELGVKPRLFTLDFGPPHDIELPIARAVAEHLGCPLHVVPARPGDIARALRPTAKALPQPYGDGVTVPLYLLGKAARQYVGEVWNGEGGDQLFGGWANKPMIAALTHGAGSGTAAEEVREYLATYHRFHGLTDRLYTRPMQEATAGIDPAGWIAPALDRERYPELLHRLRAANLRLKGAENIAPRMVALAACHGLRVRAPLFDRDLAAWSFQVSTERILAGACEKFSMKEVAEAYLPREIVWRDKRGMGVPTTEWALRIGPVRLHLMWTFASWQLQREGRFSSTLIRSLLRGIDPTPEGAFRKRRVGEKLWTLLMWELWRKEQRIS